MLLEIIRRISMYSAGNISMSLASNTCALGSIIQKAYSLKSEGDQSRCTLSKHREVAVGRRTHPYNWGYTPTPWASSYRCFGCSALPPERRAYSARKSTCSSHMRTQQHGAFRGKTLRKGHLADRQVLRILIRSKSDRKKV